MKTFKLIVIFFLLVSCGEKNSEHQVGQYVVETTVQLKEGTTSEVLALFKSTNPTLVNGESDWVRASFSALDEEDVVVVRAVWKSKESYLKFSESSTFKKTMGQFSKHFAGKPKVTISKVLFEM